MTDLVSAALGYLEAGHHIIALTQKRPSLRYHAKPDDETPGWSWDRSIHGMPEHGDHPMDGYVGHYDGCLGCEQHLALAEVFMDATTTGIALLIPPSVLVADVDTEEAAQLFSYYTRDDADRYDTRIAQTPNGLHIWYLAPGADRNRWLGGRTLLLKGLGGYVAAPPSAHFNGDGVQDGVYTWISDPGIAFLPAGLAEAIADQDRITAQDPNRIVDREPVVLRARPRAKGAEVPSLRAGTLVFVPEYDIRGLCKAIQTAPDGNQNNMIAWAAMQARDEGVPFEVAMPQLLDAALSGGHPRERAIATIKGAFTRRSRG